MAKKKLAAKKKGKKEKFVAPVAVIRIHTINGELAGTAAGAGPHSGDIIVTGFHNQAPNSTVTGHLFGNTPAPLPSSSPLPPPPPTNNSWTVTFPASTVPNGVYLVQVHHPDSGATDTCPITVQHSFPAT